ncbi:class I SAM-dependent methyltransferase [Candidatus Desantisbacteria bacterium]|nr:class I SAM-dependent methyltransferase [Candidatus Desantisbacteria bacterium]
MDTLISIKQCILCGSYNNTPPSASPEYIICKNCGLVYSSLRFSDEKLEEVANSCAQMHHLSKNRLEADFSQFMIQMVYEPRLKDISPFRKNNRILDIGCATGGWLSFLKENGWDAHGLELSPENAQYGIKVKGLNIFCGNINEASYPDEYFDVVTLWEVIEHVNDPINNLKKAYQILRKGGILALSTPNYNCLTRLIIQNNWTGMDPNSHYHLFTPSTIKKLLTKTGFKNIKIRTMDLNPYEILHEFKKDKSYEKHQEDIKKIKEKIKNNKLMYLTRAALNKILGVIPLGEKMVILAVKP